MRTPTSWFLLIVICTQMFYNLGVTAYWLANRAYIARVLCENRDRPKLHCDGKCYLRKKLGQPPADTGDNRPALPALHKGLELADMLPCAPTLPTLEPENPCAVLVPGNPCLTGAWFGADIFHPPSGGRPS